jgi:type II secretion system protein I
MRQRARHGFTLVEVVVALALLAVGVVGMTLATTPFLRHVSTVRDRTLAGLSADARLAAVRVWPEYATLDSAFAGTLADTPRAGWTQSTLVTRIGGPGQALDVKRVTVTVSGSGLVAPIRRTTTVGAP